MIRGDWSVEGARKRLAACPWCKQVPVLEQDMDDTWHVACKHERCPVMPITLPYRNAHPAVNAWNTYLQPQLPELMPHPA